MTEDKLFVKNGISQGCINHNTLQPPQRHLALLLPEMHSRRLQYQVPMLGWRVVRSFFVDGTALDDLLARLPIGPSTPSRYHPNSPPKIPTSWPLGYNVSITAINNREVRCERNQHQPAQKYTLDINSSRVDCYNRRWWLDVTDHFSFVVFSLHL